MNLQELKTGDIVWADLTVPNAQQARDFYSAVTGWTAMPVDMDGYEDFCMNRPGDGRTIAGLCHQRGVNADLPPQWLLYIKVDDLDESLRRAQALGGKIAAPPRSMGDGRVAVVQDPAGAVCALFQP